MNSEDGIDPSHLLSKNDDSDTSNNSQSHSNETVPVTLTDFQNSSTPNNNNINNQINSNSNNDAIQPPPSWRHPIESTNVYLTKLSSVFSRKFLSWLAIDNFALSGGVSTLLWSMGLPLFKELGIDASRQQLYTTMIISPYALKPFIGVASDLFPIRGYNKRYIALSSIMLGILGCSMILTLYHSGSAEMAVAQGPDSVRRLADFIVICFFAMNLESATLDISGEGKYSELMRQHPESGSSIISFKFVWSLAGTIVTQTYVGPLADAGYFHVLFWIALVLLLAPFYPTFRGWIPEKKRSSDETGMVKLCRGFMFDKGLFQKKKTPFIAIAASGLAAPIMSAVTTYADLGIGLICSGVVLVALAALTYAVFPVKFFRITIGMMLLILCRIKMTSGLSYFYTANSKCLPDGPQFSYTFYITLTGIVGSIIHLIAVVLYQTFMSSWKFRPALIFSMVVGSLATVVDLIIVMRWNVAIGIPDKVFFLLGNATFENLTNILHAIPMSAISAKMSPPGMEAAVFAYSVGIGTFCFMFSNLLGSGIILWSGMKTVGEECNFDNLPHLIIIFQILVPIIVGIPATLFIPNVLQSEQLMDWEKEKWYEDHREELDDTLETDEERSENDVLSLQADPLLV